jgi:hypothetical protein
VETPAGSRGPRWLTLLAPVGRRVARHETLLWWLHSTYVLALGTGIMWLGGRNYSWLRYSGFYILVIWTSSLFLAEVVQRREGARWNRVRLVVNYINKNLYQQLLFFILPIYAGSATLGSRNTLFVIMLGASAVLSTIDIVYDRFVSMRRTLSAWFFAFNAFAVVNVALPVLFGISAHRALRLGTLAAVVGFVTLAWRLSRFRRGGAWIGIAAGAALVVWATGSMRPFVPPAPLRLISADFGLGLDARTLRVTDPVSALPRRFGGRLFFVTAVRAPLGLTDRVELRWYRGSQLLWASDAHDITGGRREGFRLWSALLVRPGAGEDPFRVDVVTEAGQLIGRATLPARR